MNIGPEDGGETVVGERLELEGEVESREKVRNDNCGEAKGCTCEPKAFDGQKRLPTK